MSSTLRDARLVTRTNRSAFFIAVTIAVIGSLVSSIPAVVSPQLAFLGSSICTVVGIFVGLRIQSVDLDKTIDARITAIARVSASAAVKVGPPPQGKDEQPPTS